MGALPDGTAEGCKEPLRFAEDRLAEIIRDHTQIDEEGAALGVDLAENPDAQPELTRGGHVEQAASLLISAITIARSEYLRQAGEMEEDDPPERAIRPDDAQAASLGELGQKAGEIRDEARIFQKELGNPEHFNSTDAVDELKRQGRDAETLLDVVRQAARQTAIVPSVLTRIGRVLARVPDAVVVTWEGLRVAVDLTELGIKHFSNFATEQLLLPFRHIRNFADDVELHVQQFKQRSKTPQQLLPTQNHTDAGDPSKRWLPGLIFRDIDAHWCPEMVVLPAGEFTMGAPTEEVARDPKEGPQRRVDIPQPFALGRYPITVAEFDHFCRETGRTWPDAVQSSRGLLPMVDVSFEDAEAYLAWLSKASEHSYRLPSEAEWEYACRAGTTTPFWTGETISTDQANYDGRTAYGSGKRGEYRRDTTSVVLFEANHFGLHDMHGNVWEWCADTWHVNYTDAPVDGSAWLEGGYADHAILRGGAWVSEPVSCRSAYRNALHRKQRNDRIGFRAARTLG
ncbi:MAG: formylglycine-generating enzyme family protein [Pseudomonadota bacterium]